MPHFVIVPKMPVVEEHTNEKTNIRNGSNKSVSSVNQAIFGNGGGVKGMVHTNKKGGKNSGTKRISMQSALGVSKAAKASFPKGRTVSKSEVLLSDAQLKRRKKVMSGTLIGSSSLGLSALGVKGASGVIARSKKINSARKAVLNPRLDNASQNLSLTAGGTAAVGGYNMATIQRQESRRKRQMVPVLQTKKVQKAYDPEARRQKRTEAYATGAKAVGALSFGAAGYTGVNLANRQGQLNVANQKTREVQGKLKGARSPSRRQVLTESMGNYQDLGRKALRARNKSAGITAGLAGLGVAGVVGSDRIRSYNATKGRPYRPRHIKQD